MLFRFGLFLGRVLSLSQLQLAGRALGRVAFLLFRKDRGIILKQLNFVYPDLNSRQRENWCLECFKHFGQLFFEFLGMEKIDADWESLLEVENEQALKAALDQKRGVLLLGLHQGNWELLPLYAKRTGIAMNAASTNVPESRINELILQRRENPFMSIIRRGDPGAVRKLLACLKNQQVLVLINDQDTNVPSTWAPFFGIPAKTPVGVSTLALKTGALIVSYTVLRQERGRFKLSFESLGPFRTAKPAGAKDVFMLSLILNRHLDQLVRRAPQQWAWFHRRWRHRSTREEALQMREWEAEFDRFGWTNRIDAS